MAIGCALATGSSHVDIQGREIRNRHALGTSTLMDNIRNHLINSPVPWVVRIKRNAVTQYDVRSARGTQLDNAYSYVTVLSVNNKR